MLNVEWVECEEGCVYPEKPKTDVMKDARSLVGIQELKVMDDFWWSGRPE
ncbi:MAG: hypothetical protein H6561_01325 [Lewinellaceae bacterium]|nr:hypothetical protein [Lewinellaceae bacterium]